MVLRDEPHNPVPVTVEFVSSPKATDGNDFLPGILEDTQSNNMESLSRSVRGILIVVKLE